LAEVSRSQTANDNWTPNLRGGVKSTFINLGPGIGGGVQRSQGESFKLSNGIKNIKNWYNTWKF